MRRCGPSFQHTHIYSSAISKWTVCVLFLLLLGYIFVPVRLLWRAYGSASKLLSTSNRRIVHIDIGPLLLYIYTYLTSVVADAQPSNLYLSHIIYTVGHMNVMVTWEYAAGIIIRNGSPHLTRCLQRCRNVLA